MLKYNIYFFITPLLIHEKKYCLQVYYDKAILPPHFLLSIRYIIIIIIIKVY